MKVATVRELKRELETRSPAELLELCLRLSKFKKENKELLTYLLYEAKDEKAFVASIKLEMDIQFAEINTDRYFFIKKSARKILKQTKTYIRYSQNRETEIDLLIYFCSKLKAFIPLLHENKILENIYIRQTDYIKKAMLKLHEDLRYDYEMELERLESQEFGGLNLIGKRRDF
jgi:predicted nucleotidyltransferase